MQLVNIDRVPKDHAEAAGYWIMRLDSPSCGPADRGAFEAWRAAHPEHARTFARAQRALVAVDRHLGSTELTELGERAFEETRTPRRPLLRSAAVGLAAACTLIVGAVLYQQFAVGPAVGQRVLAGVSTFETAVGERSTVVLADNSTVILNTNSLVETHFTEDSDVRRIVLVRGQAHFEVQKDPRPFEVIAGDRRIVALGTAFDVRLDAERGVQVTLVEGRVSVDEIFESTVKLATETATTVEAAARAESATTESVRTETPTRTELEAGEQLIARPDEAPTVVEADVERVVGWREGRLVFRDDPLPEAIMEINRYSTRQLFVNDDARLDTIRISGVFAAGSTETFIEALEAVYPVKAQRVAYDRVALLWWDKGLNVAESFDRFESDTRDVREEESPTSIRGAERL